MSDMSVSSPETIPAPLVHDTQVAADGSAVEVGFTESDPAGPQITEKSSGLLAGKFTNQEELEKAYKELEAKLGSAHDPKTEEVLSDAPKVAGIETTDEAATMLQEKGLDIRVYTSEYERTGQLSPESYATLEAGGISRDMVNAYIDGQKVLVDSQAMEVKNSVGGTEAYDKLVSWAASHLSAQEQQAYDTILHTNDMSIIKMAAQGLKARYDAAMGTDPQVIAGGSISGRNDGLERFQSRAEMVAAMQDARYATDPAYRGKVEKKVINSNL